MATPVVAAQAKSAPILKDSDHFCPPCPLRLSTTVRTSWRVDSRPVWCAESTCSVNSPITPLVVDRLPVEKTWCDGGGLCVDGKNFALKSAVDFYGAPTKNVNNS